MQSKRPSITKIIQKLRRVRMLVLDVDGVLTDGRIMYGDDGTEFKCFDVHDGYGIQRARENGLNCALISARQSKATDARAKELGVTEIYQGTGDKVHVINEIKARNKLTDDEICYIGDDALDLPALKVVGLSAAPRDAMADVRSKVDYVTKASGGRGAVRELIDLIMRSKKLLK